MVYFQGLGRAEDSLLAPFAIRVCRIITISGVRQRHLFMVKLRIPSLVDGKVVGSQPASVILQKAGGDPYSVHKCVFGHSLLRGNWPSNDLLPQSPQDSPGLVLVLVPSLKIKVYFFAEFSTLWHPQKRSNCPMCSYVRSLRIAEGRKIQSILRRSKNRTAIRRAQVILLQEQLKRLYIESTRGIAHHLF